MAQNTWATTGLLPFTIGSTKLFQANPYFNGLPWDLSGGSATLRLTDPLGNQFALAAQIVGGGAQVSWTVVGPQGLWLAAWDLTDIQGRRRIQRPRAFQVISSPS